jgi:hypothetical protein
MTDDEKLRRALAGEYVGDAAPVLRREVRRLRAEVERLTAVVAGAEVPAFLAELRDVCSAADLCWTVGRTRLAEHECRAFPRDQTRKGPVVIEDGATFAEAVRKVTAKVRELAAPAG